MFLGLPDPEQSLFIIKQNKYEKLDFYCLGLLLDLLSLKPDVNVASKSN
jgi:hypothetical protein